MLIMSLMMLIMSGQPCVFPFLAGERLQYTCTTATDPYEEEWCATKTDQDHSVRRWGHCSQACRDIEDNGGQATLLRNIFISRPL